MKIWVICFVILFGLVELALWLKDFLLPLPIYLLGGAFLAIASNAPKGLGGWFSLEEHSPKNNLPASADQNVPLPCRSFSASETFRISRPTEAKSELSSEPRSTR